MKPKGNICIAAFVFIYTVAMLYLSLKYHTIGGFEVETDFYADFIHNTDKLLHGDVSLTALNLRGPLYYFVLGLFKVIFGEYFRAGLILNCLSSGMFLLFTMLIFKNLFGIKTAICTGLFLIGNFPFIHYTYSVGCDMFAAMLALATIYFLFKDKPSMWLVGLFACLAFFARNTNMFIYPACIVTILIMGFGIKKLIIFIGSTILVGLPWYIPNLIVNGNPYPQDGLYGIKLSYTHIPPEILSTIYTLPQLIMYNPSFFIHRTLTNIPYYFYRDMIELMGHLILGLLVVTGIIIAVYRRQFNKKQFILFIFPIMEFFLLTLLHYNVRYELFRIPFYSGLIFTPLLRRAK